MQELHKLKQKISIFGHFLKFQQSVIERVVWPYSAEHSSIVLWRAVILSSILLAGLIFGIVAFIAAAALIIKENTWTLAIVDGLGLILCFAFLFVRPIRFEIRAMITLLMFYFIGLAVILSVGPLSGGTAWLFAFAVLAGVLVGNHAAFVAIAMNAISLTGIGYLISAGVFGSTFPFFKTPQAMIAAGVNFIVLNAITAVSVSALVKGVFRLLKQKEDLAVGLEKERGQLVETKRYLEFEINVRQQAEIELKKSESTHRDFIDNAPIGMYTADLNGEFTYINSKLEEITGYRKEDWLGKSYRQIVHPEDREAVRNKLKSSANGKTADSYQIRIIDFRNDIRWVKVTSEPIVDDDKGVNTITGVKCFVEDVTRKKRSEDINKTLFAISNAVNTTANLPDLYERIHHLLGDVIDVTNFFIVILDTKERTLHFPYHVDTLDDDFSPITDFDSSDSLSGLVVAQRKPLLLRKKELDERAAQNGVWGPTPLIWMGVPLMIKEDVIGVIAVQSYTDGNLYKEQELQLLSSVSHQVAIAIERKRAEEALRESEEKFRLTYSSSPDAVNINRLDDGLYVDINEGFTRATGYTREDVIGKTSLEINIWHDPSSRVKLVQGLRAKGYFENLETQFQRKDGSLITALMSARIIFLQGVPHIISVTRDISERKLFEEKLQQAQKSEAIGTLAGGIAHDFNNLLMGIQGRASLLSSDLDVSHSHWEHLEAIEEYIGSASNLTKQLLGFAKGGKYEVKPIDISKLVLRTSALFGRTKKEIKIHTKCQELPMVVEADRGQIEQVLLNMYVNAWQAMSPNGGELHLETKIVTLDEAYCRPNHTAPGHYVNITVTDTGSGIDEANLKRIFDPFFTTKEKERGTGMGLASAYGIIKNHGGMISVRSEVGHGTTFNIHLPVSDKEALREVTLKDVIIKGSATILLVDDEDLIIHVGQAMLENLGYRVIVANDGDGAIKILTEIGDQIDLVILDMIMPGMDGGKTFDCIQALRPMVPVLLSSGYSFDGNAQEIIRRGCNGFIQKPYKISELSNKVRKVLDEAKENTQQ